LLHFSVSLTMNLPNSAGDCWEAGAGGQPTLLAQRGRAECRSESEH
jgi:hypothetical protein